MVNEAYWKSVYLGAVVRHNSIFSGALVKRKED